MISKDKFMKEIHPYMNPGCTMRSLITRLTGTVLCQPLPKGAYGIGTATEILIEIPFQTCMSEYCLIRKDICHPSAPGRAGKKPVHSVLFTMAEKSSSLVQRNMVVIN